MPDVTKLPAAPEGSHWEFSEVKTNHGKDSLGERPVLVWDSLAGATAFLGEDKVCDSLNGTSLLVSYQSIARRITISGSDPAKRKSDEEIDTAIAQAILEFRPGKRTESSSPAASAGRQARALAEAVGESGADAVANLLKKIRDKVAAGEMSAEDVANLSI